MSTQIQTISDTLDELSVTSEAGGLFMDETIDSWISYGTLTAVQELLSQGAQLPNETVEKYIAEAKEVVNRKS